MKLTKHVCTTCWESLYISEESIVESATSCMWFLCPNRCRATIVCSCMTEEMAKVRRKQDLSWLKLSRLPVTTGLKLWWELSPWVMKTITNVSQDNLTSSWLNSSPNSCQNVPVGYHLRSHFFRHHYLSQVTCIYYLLFLFCLSVCLLARLFKNAHGFGWNVACRQMSGHGRTD